MDLFGRTPVHVACILGAAEHLAHVSAAHDLDAKDRYGLTALHYAVLGGHRTCVEALHRAAPATFLRNLAPKNESAELQSHGDDQLLVAELNPKDMTPAENLTLSADRTQVVSNMGWGSVRSTVGIRLGDVGKTFFYEARVDSGGIIQVGWGTKRCRMSATDGIGDDRNSWAWDGFRKRIWHAGGSIFFHHTPLWQTNDVVTAYATIIEVITAQDDQEGNKERKFASVQMGARINGKDLGIESTAQLPIESEDDILYPGVSLVRAEAVTLNFGYRPFVHPMGNWVSVAEAAASWERVREHVPFSSVLLPVASPVHYAAACGHNEVLEYLFAHTAPEALVDLLLTKDAEGRNPFHYACRYAGNVGTLRFLLAQEEKLNSQKESSVWWSIGQLKIRDKFGRSPLIHACDQSHPEVVQFLLEAGAQPTEVDGDAVSALYHAIDHDCAPVASILMDHGVDIEARDRLQDTALTFAAKNGALECMKLLVSRGANTSARDAEGSTVLLASLINGYAPLVKYLLTTGISEATEHNHEGDTAMLTTARTSSVECAELLLAHGASLDDKDNNDNNALMYAASGKSPEMVRWLIGKGLDVNAVNRDQQTPICLAAASGPVENLRILIEHGAKANHARIDGRTPFLIAAACGREEVCQYLLFNGHATLNEVDRRGNSALVLACSSAATNCARFLLEHGADPNDRDRNGTAALLFACSEGDLELVELLIANGADTRIANSTRCTPLLAAGLAGKLSTIRYLLSNGHASVAERDEGGGSVLLYACREGSVECLEFLLSQGASLDETDNRGITPLVYAATSGNVEVVEWLLSVKKVDVDQEVMGSTAVHFAISRGRARAAAALLDHGARLDIPSLSPDGPQVAPALVQACSSGSIETVELLLARGFDLRDDRGREYVEAALHTGSPAFCRWVFGRLDEIDLAQPADSSDDDRELAPAAVVLLCDALADNDTVERLDLARQGLTDADLSCLAALLARNRHLSWLDLGGNHFTLAGFESFLAQVRAHNRSLLTLQIDLDHLAHDNNDHNDHNDDDEAGGARQRETEAERRRRVQALEAAVADMSAQARRFRREVGTTAVRMLVVARLLLQPPPITQFGDDSPLAELPGELLEAIVAGVDAHDVLDADERKRVVAFALDPQGTLGKSREQFLRACLRSLTWWPGPDALERKRKRDPEEEAEAEDEAELQKKNKGGGGGGQADSTQPSTPGAADSRWPRFLRRFFR